ncbi:MAG: xanthine dehydrogenase family protein molybdopterin-binding subunit [Anaerolineaceae bacterium]|nr:xanthine dehydrogenase family protein molybdopterin-binding subunit [Anaerolineaceae bacterium]
MEIGKILKRVDAEAKVTGEALYPGDINFENQLYLKTLFSEKPHAVVKNIDTSLAENIPGVILILTAKDVPNNEYGLIMPDQPVLCGPGSNKLFAERVRCVSDQIALIIAESEKIAQIAKNSIIVEYEDLPVINNPDEAMLAYSVCIHPEIENNLLLHYKIRDGDIEKAFSEVDVIIEGKYSTPMQEHAYLQPEAGLSYLDEEGRITVIVAGQWVHEDQEQIAHALNLPLEKVRVIYPAIGGAFGGREDMSVQITLALATLRLSEIGMNRPVKTIWSREESIIGHHKRHAYTIYSKWGATKEGKVLAAEVKVVADAGAYAYTSTKVQGNATLMCTGPYEIPNVKVDSFTVYTNNVPGGAFRGFGGPQAAFSAEMQMNKLADKLNLDPVEIRMRNILKEGSKLPVKSSMPAGVSLPEVVERCALEAGWRKIDGNWTNPALRIPSGNGKIKGLGFACGYKNIGFSFGAPENCWATIELIGSIEIEKVILYHAGAEVGQGSHTVFCQMAADAVGVDINKVELVASDTSTSDNSGSVSASRMTFMAGNSIFGAGKLALEKWKNEERPAIGRFQYKPPKTTPYDKDTGECIPNFSYGYVAEAVEAEVDTETGEVHLTKVICADDVGKAINPQLVVGQIEGAIVQAAGYGLMENFIQEEGYVKTSLLSTYLIPTVLDIPDEIESIIMEHPDPNGPWGARGVGEMPYIPLVPAISSAIHSATGIWMDRFPMTPETVLRGLGKIDDE